MFKNKNKITKISNGLFLFIIVLSILMLFTLINNGVSDSITYETYIYAIVIYSSYIIFGGLLLLIPNKVMNLYSDDYPISRSVLNLFILLFSYSILTMITSIVADLIINSNFSLENIIDIVVGYIPCCIVGYLVINNGKMLSDKNDKKTNITNAIVIYLLMDYALNVIINLISIIFHTEEVLSLLSSICLSLIFICIIIIAYNMTKKVK